MPWLVQLIVGLALSLASSLIQSALQQDKKQLNGVRSEVQTGGDNPLAFIMGFYATAGQLEYIGTWGDEGEVPNAYLTKVVSVSDLPVRNLAGFLVNGVRCNILWDEPYSGSGYPVLEYRDANGKDHLWVFFYDGTQTTASPSLLTKFGADPDRPWQADMIGRGVAYAEVTALINRELFTGIPEYIFEVDGIPLDDPRGGTAQHDNPIVAAYNVMLGLRYGGQWVYGLQGMSANRLPNWPAQMDKCDVIQDDGRKRFRFGLEVTVDTEPHVVLGELFKACEARIAEIGGTYKVLVGEPDAPVVSFTDEDIVISADQTFDPFPGLEATYNAITATYPEPGESWEIKEAPPRYRSDLELLDDSRRLPFSTEYKAVPFAVQVQALMRAAIEETRRFRRHVHTMPPQWWEYEPLDVAVWTSGRNGYANKQFLITAMDDMPNVNQVVGFQEIDPTDYSWHSGYVLPYTVTTLVIARPVPQVVSGPSVAPVPGALAFDAFWSAPSVAVDVDFVRITHRLPGDDSTRVTLPVPKPDLLLGAARVMVPVGYGGTTIEVQLEYISGSGRPMVASAWMPVTIAIVTLPAGDLSEELQDQRALALRSIEEMTAERSRSIAQFANALLDGAVDMQTLRTEVTARFVTTQQEITAAYTSEINVIAGIAGALSDRTETLEAKVDHPATGLSATAAALNQVQVRVTADLLAQAEMINALEVRTGDATAGFLLAARVTAGPAGAEGAIQLGLRSSVGGAVTWTGIMIVRMPGGIGKIYLDAEETIVTGRLRDVAGRGYIDFTTGEQRWESA